MTMESGSRHPQRDPRRKRGGGVVLRARQRSAVVRRAGVALAVSSALLVAACGGQPSQAATSPTATPTPLANSTPTRQPNFWPQDLHASGAFTTSISTTDPQGGGHDSACSGNAPGTGKYSLLLWWVRTPEHNSLSVEVAGYKGPGGYTQGVTATNVAPLTVQRWTTTAGDPATFTVAAGEESGTMDVTMSDPLHPDRAKLTIKGSWSCVTGEKSQL
jgi:hypothetical protein